MTVRGKILLCPAHGPGRWTVLPARARQARFPEPAQHAGGGRPRQTEPIRLAAEQWHNPIGHPLFPCFERRAN